MLSTSAASLTAIAARLRSGIITADHFPAAIAELIERLAAERRAMAAQIEDLERAITPAAARNAYAAGFRDALAQGRSYLDSNGYGNIADGLFHLQPDFARAGQVAQETAT